MPQIKKKESTTLTLKNVKSVTQVFSILLLSKNNFEIVFILKLLLESNENCGL